MAARDAATAAQQPWDVENDTNKSEIRVPKNAGISVPSHARDRRPDAPFGDDDETDFANPSHGELESMTMPDKIIHIVGQKLEGMRLSAIAAAVGLGVDRTKLVMDLCKLVAFGKLVYFAPGEYPREGRYRLAA